ncbi:hypothetical protein ES702_00213 [subsurface metagenome]
MGTVVIVVLGGLFSLRDGNFVILAQPIVSSSLMQIRISSSLPMEDSTKPLSSASNHANLREVARKPVALLDFQSTAANWRFSLSEIARFIIHRFMYGLRTYSGDYSRLAFEITVLGDDLRGHKLVTSDFDRATDTAQRHPLCQEQQMAPLMSLTTTLRYATRRNGGQGTSVATVRLTSSFTGKKVGG